MINRLLLALALTLSGASYADAQSRPSVIAKDVTASGNVTAGGTVAATGSVTSGANLGATGNLTIGGTLNGKALPSGAFVGTTDTQTLTGKTITSDQSTFINSGTGPLTRTVQNWLRDSAHARDYGITCDGTTIDTVNAGKMVTNEAGASIGRVIELPAGVCILNDLSITGNNIILDGAGKDKTVLKPGAGATTSVLNINSATNVIVRDLTINTTGTSIRNVTIDRSSQAISFFDVGFVGNLSGDLVYNEGDTTLFDNSFVFATSANTWFINYAKDAASSGTPYAGNNHLVIGGIMYGGSGTGGQGIRVTQYNGTNTTRRVEGVKINGWSYISNGATAVQIGNSLYVQVLGCIIDQFTNAGIVINGGADQATIQNNYIGAIPPTTNKVGVFVAKTAGKMTDISGNTFGNLDYGVQVLADASTNVTDVGIVNNRSWFITVQPYYFDSVTKLVFMGNRDQSTTANGTVGTAQTRSANTGTFVGNVMNANNPAPYGTVTGLKFSANIGPTGFYGN